MAISVDAVKDATITTDSWCVTEHVTTTHSFLWTINNFSRVSEDFDSLMSSTFPTDENKLTEWAIILYIREEGTKNGTNYVSVYLELLKSSEKQIKAKYEFSVIMGDGKKTNTSQGKKIKFTEKVAIGDSKFVARETLFDKSKGLLVDDKLRLYCEVTIIHDLANISSGDVKSTLGESSTSTLLKDLGGLFGDSLFSDVTLNVSGRQISAHKAILSARSPVFAAMFKQEVKKSSKNEVDITDISYETMENVLRFIYTGKVPQLETMAANLLSAANKYSLEQLKLMCEDACYSHISIENACDTFLLANMHNASWLKLNVIHFINKHGSSVKNTGGWITLLKVAPHLFGELY